MKLLLKTDAKHDEDIEAESIDIETVERSNDALLWEPTPPTKLKIQDLDLDKSYVDQTKAHHSTREVPRVQTRWIHKGASPLMDYKKLPKGWNVREPDLDPFDIDSQIARCHERIADNIMPFIFEERLKEYELGKAAREKMAVGEPQGLGRAVIQRIDTLKIARIHLQEQGDPDDQLKNLTAILKAYRRNKLDWNDGLVTYWSYGKQLCQPRPFRWDEFEAINSAHKGTKGFWTEGLHHHRQGSVEMASIRIPPSLTFPYLHFLNVAVRFAGVSCWTELHCLHDTGADMMSIFEADIPRIMGPFRNPLADEPPLVGVATARPAHGPAFTTKITRLEVTLLNEKGQAMTPWTLVECQVKPGSYILGTHTYRADGPALRSLLYQAHVPDGRDLLYIANQKHSLHLPRLVSRPSQLGKRAPTWRALPDGLTWPLPPSSVLAMAESVKNPPPRARGTRE